MARSHAPAVAAMVPPAYKRTRNVMGNGEVLTHNHLARQLGELCWRGVIVVAAESECTRGANTRLPVCSAPHCHPPKHRHPNAGCRARHIEGLRVHMRACACVATTTTFPQKTPPVAEQHCL